MRANNSVFVFNLSSLASDDEAADGAGSRHTNRDREG
jgi:hypothetical protein